MNKSIDPILSSTPVDSEFRNLLHQEFSKRMALNSRYSLRSFARSLELAPSTVHQYLSGRYYPSARNLEQIAEKLKWQQEVWNPMIRPHRASRI